MWQKEPTEHIKQLRAIERPCPRCGAEPNERCRTVNGDPFKSVHDHHAERAPKTFQPALVKTFDDHRHSMADCRCSHSWRMHRDPDTQQAHTCRFPGCDCLMYKPPV